MRIGYCRVSTDKTEQDTSVDAQEEALKRAGCVRVFKERASAFKPGVRRKQWELCKELIATGKITHFMICSLSRGSRQQENADMSRLCKANNVQFIVLDGTNADVSTPEGLLMVGILDTVNRVDSTIKGLAVKRGQAARKAAGATACGRCPFGYRYDGTKPVPDPKRWKQAQTLWQQLKESEFIANRVLRENPEWPFSNVGLIKWMRNPLLMGRPAYTDLLVEPLVPAKEWLQCQDLLSRRAFHKARSPRVLRLFSQRVTCFNCGRFMQYQLSGSTVIKPRLKCQNPRCEYYGRGLAEFKVRDQMISVLEAAVPQMLYAVEQATQSKDKPPSAEQIALQQKLDSLQLLQRSGVKNLGKAISATRFELEALTVRSGANWAGWGDLIRQPGFFKGMTDRELRPVMAELVEEILYVGNSKQVEITLRDPA